MSRLLSPDRKRLLWMENILQVASPAPEMALRRVPRCKKTLSLPPGQSKAQQTFETQNCNGIPEGWDAWG